MIVKMWSYIVWIKLKYCGFPLFSLIAASSRFCTIFIVALKICPRVSLLLQEGALSPADLGDSQHCATFGKGLPKYAQDEPDETAFDFEQVV